MDNSQVTEKQHYVPKVYLKRFSDDKGILNVLDLENKRIGKPKHYSQVCYKKYFYGQKTGIRDDVSQLVEDYLKSVEDNLGNFLDEFENKVLQDKEINEWGLWQMAYVISFMWIRSLGFRLQMNKMESNFMKQLIHLDVDNLVEMGNVDGCKTQQEKKEMKEFISNGEYDITFNNVSQLKYFAEVEDFARRFVIKRWLIHISACDYNFITSDNPIVESFPYAVGIYGRDIWSRHQFFPISPKVLIELQLNKNVESFGKRVKRKRIFDKNQVMKYNLLRADSSVNYCYNNRRTEVDDLILLRDYVVKTELNKLFK
ncbi:TPA: hypothetical protein DF272_05020 [Candidatus Falkowbacteria bacterium]|nr:hypothetical protein [Candidatus Falkowbacteria bacterium]